MSLILVISMIDSKRIRSFEICLRKFFIFVWKLLLKFFSKVFLMLWFSLPYKLSRIRRNSVQVNCLSLNRYLLLKKWRHWAISVKKKISHNNYLKLYLILTHHKTKLFVFFLFFILLKGNGSILIFYTTPKNKQFHEAILNFPG